MIGAMAQEFGPTICLYFRPASIWPSTTFAHANAD